MEITGAFKFAPKLENLYIVAFLMLAFCFPSFPFWEKTGILFGFAKVLPWEKNDLGYN